MKKLILGTRDSALALTQARMVKAALSQAWPELDVAIREIKTTGDLRPDLRLAEFNRGPEPVDKGIFTKELEIALAAGEIDIAVHSLKDVPTELGEGFRIAAVLPRADVADVIVSKTPGGLDGLPYGAVVATSSTRRIRQLLALRPDLKVEEMRGNVPTRLKKLAQGSSLAAILLAKAGLDRLGFFQSLTYDHGTPLHMTVLPPALFLPAASQGAIGVEVYGQNPALAEILEGINHDETNLQIRAERHFLHLLQAGCHTPVGVLTGISGSTLTFEAAVFDEADLAAPARRCHAKGSVEAPEKVAEAAWRMEFGKR